MYKKKNNNNEINFKSNENYSHIRLLKNSDIKTEESVNKRTKSEYNNINSNLSNSAKKNINSKSFKKGEIKHYKENKKINIINSMYKNNNKEYNINPRKTKYIINSKGQLKELSDKEAHSLINYNINSNMCFERFNTGSKFNENINNYNLKICDTSRDKMKNNNNNYYNRKEIKIDGIINGKIKRPLTLMKKEDGNKKEKENNDINMDFISEHDFMKELNNKIKTNKIIVNLTDLLNHNFNPDDTKNLNTTSATTLLEKNENAIITMNENNNNININNNNNKIELKKIEKDKKNINNNLEEEKSDFFAGSCDEFTYTEMIKKDEPYLINRIPLSNYEIKINENKKEIKHIIEMSKDELMRTYLIYKNKYEKYLEKVKKYLNIINLNEIKNMYSNINTLNNIEIKKIVDSIVDYTKKKFPGQNVDELVDDLYNLISYEIKYKIAEKKIDMK